MSHCNVRNSFLAFLAIAFSFSVSLQIHAGETERLLLVTIDGLRWQEVFGGADLRLIDKEAGGVERPEEVRAKYGSGDAAARRETLLPFFWDVIVQQGQVFGDPARNCHAMVTNGLFFSYPGYHEILCGFPEPEITSNDKVPNPNVNVLEWLNSKPKYQGQVAAFGSWDVFPFILNQQRSGLCVNAGWQALEIAESPERLEQVNALAEELPRYWQSVRYDVFTMRGAMAYLHQRRPKLLYVALGETDDWAHAGRYDLYLDAARRSDRYLQTLWETMQSLPEYAGKTSLVVTTDHGRGDGREGWKSHGVDYPGSDRIWIAVLGPDTPAAGSIRNYSVTQGQVAATVSALLGEDYALSNRRVTPALPGAVTREFRPAPDAR